MPEPDLLHDLRRQLEKEFPKPATDQQQKPIKPTKE